MSELSGYLELDRFSDDEIVASQRYLAGELGLEEFNQCLRATLSDDFRMDLLVTVSVLDRLAKEACQGCDGDVLLETIADCELLPEGTTDKIDASPAPADILDQCQGIGPACDPVELDSWKKSVSGWSGFRGLLALAACLLFTFGWILSSWLPRADSMLEDSRPMARVAYLEGVIWSDGARQYQEWSVVSRGETLEFDSGMIELSIDDEVQIVLEGPAELELLSKDKAFLHRGKLVARVGPEGIGYSIDTPHALVIDLGTEFSISLTEQDRTDVVVYKGEVDLTTHFDNAEAVPRRLTAGEAVSVGKEGKLGRITSVRFVDFVPPPRLGRVAVKPSKLIVSVTDNVKSLETSKYYWIVDGGFSEDCRAFVDRNYEWNGVDQQGLPSFLRGADYVETFNDAKVWGDLRITVEVSRPAVVYVLFADRNPVPDWLTRDFVDTGWDVGMDEGIVDLEGLYRHDPGADVSCVTDIAVGAGKSINYIHSVWRREVAKPGTVCMGPLDLQVDSLDPHQYDSSMYGIVVVPREEGFH